MSEHQCPDCGSSFESKRGLVHHGVQSHDGVVEGVTPWKDEETLRELYVGQGLSHRKIAEILDCHKNTVRRWMNRFGIESRDRVDAAARGKRLKPAPYMTDVWGYESWKTEVAGKGRVVRIHRLLAVAEYGLDEVVGKDVHHLNGIKWDNRPENIVPLTRQEHFRRHGKEFDPSDDSS